MNLEIEGYEVIEKLLPEQETEQLLTHLAQKKISPLRGGIRCIDQLVPEVGALALSPRLRDLAGKYLSGEPRLVRAIYFDKNAENNWLVAWHQDRTIALSNCTEIEGWGPWSRKADVWHVQPPLAVLESMVTVRLHLDRADRENGCLKVLPGSHRSGLIASDKVHEQIDPEKIVFCEVPAGGAVVMRPHLLHASEKSRAALPRRVLHFEYSSFQLPAGMEWAA